ncbi:MAG: archaellin/type IV pilin N-terminal domain-containing protein [Thermoplasmata archaeon]
MYHDPRRGRPRRRAVSPVIGIILLVAITVVLAAVLYVMVAGLLPHTQTAPLGSEFYAGPATGNIVGSSATHAYCAASHYCYSIAIDEVGGGIALNDLNFVVRTSTGATREVSQNTAQLSIVDLKGTVVAYTQVKKNNPFAVTDWQKISTGFSSSTPLTTQDVIWLQFGDEKTAPYGQGLTLECLGTGPYSGSIDVSLP